MIFVLYSKSIRRVSGSSIIYTILVLKMAIKEE